MKKLLTILFLLKTCSTTTLPAQSLFLPSDTVIHLKPSLITHDSLNRTINSYNIPDNIWVTKEQFDSIHHLKKK